MHFVPISSWFLVLLMFEKCEGFAPITHEWELAVQVGRQKSQRSKVQFKLYIRQRVPTTCTLCALCAAAGRWPDQLVHGSPCLRSLESCVRGH